MSSVCLCTDNGQRLPSLDFIRAVMIFLMVLFHLSNFNCQYLRLSDYVYSFHMMTFLLISGFLFNPEKPLGKFWHSYRLLLGVYSFFNLLYIISFWFYGTMTGGEQEQLSFALILGRLVSAPVGTLWYIYMLLAAMPIIYILNILCNRQKLTTIILSACIFYGISLLLPTVFMWRCVIFFLLGQLLRTFRLSFIPSWLLMLSCIIGLVIIGFYDNSFQFCIPVTIANTMLYFILFICVYERIKDDKIKTSICWIGKNTLPVVCWSFFFTPFISVLYRFFSFDNLRILYGIIASILVIALSYMCACIMDKTKISQLLFGTSMIK